MRILSEDRRHSVRWAAAALTILFSCGSVSSAETSAPHLQAGALAVLASAPSGRKWDPARPVRSLPSPGEIRRKLGSSSACGVDFVEAMKVLGQIETWVRRPLDQSSGRRLAQALTVSAGILRESDCIEVCQRAEVDPAAGVVVEKLRELTLAFYGNVWIDPADRRAAMVSAVLLRLGPDYWREGFDTIVRQPLTPPPNGSWSKLYRNSGLRRQFDIEVWKVGYTPAGILRRISDQQSVTDFRVDVAAILTAAQLDREDRHELFRDYEVHLYDYRGLQWKLNEVKEALRSTLKRELRATGHLPKRLHDNRGDLLPRYCVEPEDDPDTPLTGNATSGSPQCWFTGWPGIRILDYETYGDICLMRAVGYGFDFEATWWLAFDDPEFDDQN